MSTEAKEASAAEAFAIISVQFENSCREEIAKVENSNRDTRPERTERNRLVGEREGRDIEETWERR